MWIVVSWAWRRAQNSRGGGASLRNVIAASSIGATRSAATSAA